MKKVKQVQKIKKEGEKFAWSFVIVCFLLSGAVLLNMSTSKKIILNKNNNSNFNKIEDYKISDNKLLLEQEKVEQSKIKEWSNYLVVDGICTVDNCLFYKNESDYPVGVATIKGYYTKYLDKAWDEEKYCDSIVITDGPKVLMDSYIRLVDMGNTINDKNNLNQPIVNISTYKLSQIEKNKLLGSNITDPIEMVIFKDLPQGVGAPVCFSDADIIEVK